MPTIGIFVSRSELEEKADEVIASEVAESVRSYLDPDEDLISISKTEFEDILQSEEERILLMENLKAEIKSLTDDIGAIEERIEKIEEKVGRIEKIEEKMEDIADVTQKLEKIIMSQTDAIEKQQSDFRNLVSKIIDKL